LDRTSLVERAARNAALALSVAALSTGVVGCKRHRGGNASAAGGPPPIERFAPGEWKNNKGETLVAPDAALRTWRVLMLQEKPRPKKNPRWQAIAAKDSGTLQMPPGSSYRCVFNPIQFRPWSDEWMKSVERWDVLRNVRCSADGFRTYSQAIHRVTFAPDGKELGKSSDQAELYLHERLHGEPTDITIVLRSD